MNDDSKNTLWVAKASTGTELFQQTGNIHDIKLSCDCTCVHCKDIYNSYLEEKAMAGLLHDTLEHEKEAYNDLIMKVKLNEEQNEAEIIEKNETIEKVRLASVSINEQLQHEREIRMQEAYKLEASNAEILKLEAEIKSLNNQLVSRATDQLNSVEQFNMKCADLDRAIVLNKNLNSQLVEYEREIIRLEALNTQLRLQLNSVADSNYLGNHSSEHLSISNSTSKSSINSRYGSKKRGKSHQRGNRPGLLLRPL